MKNPANLTDSDKNTMPVDAVQPLQNVVVVPPQVQPPQHPAPQDNAILQLMVNPAFQMTVAERIGVNNIVNEFYRIYQNNFAPQIQQFQGHQGLERATYWICREIDTMLMVGNNYNGILNSDNLLRRIALVGSYGILPQPLNIVPFETLPFTTQMYLMNLTIFIVRYLSQHPAQA